MRTTLGTAIHSKSGKVCGVCFSVTKNSAEKMRKSWNKNFATKVPKSIKSLKMHHSKAKCIKLWHQEHVNQRFSAFCQRLFKTSGPLFVTHCRIVSFQGLRLIVFAFSEIFLRKIWIFCGVRTSRTSSGSYSNNHFIFQLVYHNFTSGPKQNICLHFQNVTITIAGPGENWQGKVWWRPGQQVIGEI